MAFIDIKTEFSNGNFGVKETSTRPQTEEIFTSGLFDTLGENNIIFLKSATIVSRYVKDLGDTSNEDIQKPFTVEIGNQEDTTYNAPPPLTGLDTIEKNIETEYKSGQSAPYIPKIDVPKGGFLGTGAGGGVGEALGDFVDRATKDVIWMAKYLNPVGKNFFGETGGFWFLANQQFLQTFSARTSTKIYNPFSLFRVRGLSPHYQLPSFIDIKRDFPWGNHHYTKWMEQKIEKEPNTVTPPIPNAFTRAVLAVTAALGVKTDDRTLFERYIEDGGISTELSSNNTSKYNAKNLFYNEGSQAFINPWSYSKDNLTKTQFPKIYVRDDGSPYITRKNENPELTSPRAKAPGGGSFLTDWIQLYDASSLAPEFTDFKKDWPDAKDVATTTAHKYFAYDYEQIGQVARGELKKYSAIDFIHPDGAKNVKSIRQITSGSRLSYTNFGYSQYQKDLDIRKMGSMFGEGGDVSKVEGNDWRDAVDKINMLDYDDPDIDKKTGLMKSGLKDVIPFKIHDIYNDKYIIFRSLITSIVDSPKAEWSEKSYVGRQDKVHIYTGVSRNFNFSLKAMAYSLAEMKPLWRKLNYLIGLQYPHKTSEENPKMIAPFIKLTLGSFLKDTYGYINSLTITYPDDFPWELGGYTADDGFPDGVAPLDYNIQLPMGFELTIDFTIIPNKLLHSTSQHIFGAPETWFPKVTRG